MNNKEKIRFIKYLMIYNFFDRISNLYMNIIRDFYNRKNLD